MNWETLLCFGDDLTIGEEGKFGYPDYAGAELDLDPGNNWNVISRACNGFRAIDLDRYITQDFMNLKQFSADVITVLVGMNDARCGTPPGEFAISFKQVVLKSLLVAPYDNVLLMKLPVLPDGGRNGSIRRANELIELYNKSITGLAAQFRLRVIDLQLLEQDHSGKHLSVSGARHAGKQLADIIREQKNSIRVSTNCLTVLKANHG